jgi:hypothetical protein
MNRVHGRLQVRIGSPVPCFYGRTLSRAVPAACTGPPCLKWSNLWCRPNLWRPPKISLISVISVTPQQSLFLLICVLSKNPKIKNDHYHCPISVFILTTSKLEAIYENYRCSLKLVKLVLGGGGRGGALLCTSFHLSGEQVQWVAFGYARMVAPFHCPISVSFSFFSFLCFVASWPGVDKKYSHYLCRTFSVQGAQ